MKQTGCGLLTDRGLGVRALRGIMGASPSPQELTARIGIRRLGRCAEGAETAQGASAAERF
jgi:hypothetical protein